MRKKRLIIVGNGMGTCRFLDELERREGLSQFEISVYGDEPGGAYSRLSLSYVLGGEPADSIVTKPVSWYAERGVQLYQRTKVTRLDTTSKNVETEDGQSRRYDLAVIATGSLPLVPPIPGVTVEHGELRPGTFVYRTLDDCRRMREYARSGDGAIVLGGGLLGLEAAKVLSDLGLHVTVVHLSQTLMNAQLDPLGGELLEKQIERCGIFVRTERTVESVYGEERVEGVVLDDGTKLAADMLVVACGIRPRIDLARASGLPVNKGIVVNDGLATEVPGVYAFGECAEHRGRTYGIVAPVWEQASVLADVLCGKNPMARYQGSKLYARLKVAGVDVASMGSIEPELETDQVIQIVEERKSAYRKLIIREGKLVGAMLVGNTAATSTLIQIFDRGDPMPEDPLEVLCNGAGSAAPVDRTICNCHKVSESALKEAIANGSDTVEALGECTKAGTGCGSCKTEIAQIIARTPVKTTLPMVAAG